MCSQIKFAIKGRLGTVNFETKTRTVKFIPGCSPSSVPLAPPGSALASTPSPALFGSLARYECAADPALAFWAACGGGGQWTEFSMGFADCSVLEGVDEEDEIGEFIPDDEVDEDDDALTVLEEGACFEVRLFDKVPSINIF